MDTAPAAKDATTTNKDAPEALAACHRRHVAAPWQCGRRRLDLRQSFNTNEIDAAVIISKYDADQSGSLDINEVKPLVQNYCKGELVTQADVEYFLKVADINKDSLVSRGEILHGLQALYALQNLPKSVDLTLKEHGMADCALPTADALKEMLIVVNESQPVSLEEAEQVRSMALVLGASEEHATVAQLKGAIAEWYLEIERQETPAAHLGKKSLHSSVAHVMRFLKGEFEITPNTIIAGGCVLAFIGVLLPMLEIIIADTAQRNEKDFVCEHPAMRGTLRTTGWLTLALTAAAIVAVLMNAYRIKPAKQISAGVALVLIVILLTMEAYGVMHVWSSTSWSCGVLLWTTCYLTYCVFPLCVVAFVIFGLPCIFVREYTRHRALDSSLMARARHGHAQHLHGNRGSSPDIAVKKLPEAEHWQCGPQRLALRTKFSHKEIDAAKVIRKYDTDGSGVLECDELQQLLTDYNGQQPISPEDLDYIIRVSDIDRDDTISKDEVMYGLRVWYAFRNMPKAVGQAFTKHKVHDGPLPSAKALHEFLATLNEAQPVREEEVDYVRQVALALGGSEERVTVTQLRRAVATWYLHIKRPEIGQGELMRKSFHDARHRLTNVKEHARQILHGHVDYHSMTVLSFMTMGVFIVLILPLMELLVASGFPSSKYCEYPDLSSKLWWTGILTLTTATAAIGSMLASAAESINVYARRAVHGVLAALTTVLLTNEFFGVLYSMSSTVTRCGLMLWTFCSFAYVAVPLLTLVITCCGLPCLFCSEYYDNMSIDNCLDSVDGMEA